MNMKQNTLSLEIAAAGLMADAGLWILRSGCTKPNGDDWIVVLSGTGVLNGWTREDLADMLLTAVR